MISQFKTCFMSQRDILNHTQKNKVPLLQEYCQSINQFIRVIWMVSLTIPFSRSLCLTSFLQAEIWLYTELFIAGWAGVDCSVTGNRLGTSVNQPHSDFWHFNCSTDWIWMAHCTFSLNVRLACLPLSVQFLSVVYWIRMKISYSIETRHSL